GISFHAPQLPIVSNLTGEPGSDELCSADYWVQHVRHTVRFADGVGSLAAKGVGGFLEIGPDGALIAMVDECLRSIEREDDTPTVAPAVRAGASETRSLLSALGELWTRGASVDWAAMLGAAGASGGEAVELPTYPFQRERYWLESGSPVRQERERSPVSDLRYRVSWKPIAASLAPALDGTWLVVLPSHCGDGRSDMSLETNSIEGSALNPVQGSNANPIQKWCANLIEVLRGHGAQVLPIQLEQGEDSRARLCKRLRDALGALPDGDAVRGVVSLLALEEASGRSHASPPTGLSATLALTQALGDVQLEDPLWLVTRGAVSVAPSDRVSSPTQAQIWGLGLTIGLEHPQRWGGLLDLPETLDERSGSLLAGALADASAEDQLAVRGAGLLARRLTRSHAEQPTGERWRCPQGTVLITGGTGGLGGQVARRLARRGAEHLLLLSRRGADAPGAEQLRVELVELGAEVTIIACDVAERERLTELIGSLLEHRPLCGVVHTAGAGAHGAIETLTESDLRLAISAKAVGASHLDELTRDLDLSMFVLFSSIAGTLGSGLQGAYAAANAHLDALAAQRHALGLPATSIAWGPWEGAGMADGPTTGEALRRHGLEPMASSAALDALEDALLREERFAMVADIRWDSYAPLFAFARPRPLIEDLTEARTALRAPDRQPEGTVAADLRSRIREASPEGRRQISLKLVRTEVARVLGHPTLEAVDPKRAFRELGFDSLTAVELRNRLESATGLGLATTLAFDYPTPAVLADHLLAELDGDDPAGSASADVELARFERSLASLDDSAERSGVAARLRTLLARLESEDRELSRDGQTGGVAVAERLEVASDEEIFEFIDQELDSPERRGNGHV
ncbi:MAG TPA: SDR family NAD(P)-dependent oxidoreductase, partial [Solirubrobacteraceae bacterium]|nr:SDR family NAD(P)-dependent oxidoreductase [Solirubrobacteraceae bacterium]